MSNLKSKLLQSARGITVGMVLMQLLKGCFSIALVMTTASLFGAGIERDSWVIGWSVQVIVFKLLFGPINEIFRSRFLHLKEDIGESEAKRSAFSLLIFLFAISILIVALFIFFHSAIVPFFAPGYIELSDRLAIEQMVLILMPTLILSEFITLFVALLNSYQSFYLPEIFGVFSVLFNILLLLFAGQFLGIYSLVIAHYISSVFLFALLVYFLYKKGIYLTTFKFSLHSALPFLIFSLPLYFSYSVGQINAWVERILVSFLAVGNTSALDYARKFIDMPITIIITVGSTVMTPLLASIWVKEKHSLAFQQQFFLFLRLGLLIISPIVLLFSVGGVDVIELLLHRGNFNAEWIGPTAETLSWFGLGLYGVVFYSISGQALIVQKKTFHYAIIAIIGQTLPIAINYFFYQQLGLRVFGISWCIAQYLCGLIMFLSVKSFHQKSIIQLLLLLLVLAFNLVCGYWLLPLIQTYTPLVKLGLLFMSSLLIAFFCFKVFKVDELKAFKNLFSRST